MDPLAAPGSSSSSSATGPFNHSEKRRKQQLAPEAASADPLKRFLKSPNPPEIQEISPDLAVERERLQERVRTVSASSDEFVGVFSPERAKEFVTARQAVVDDLTTHLRTSRQTVREAQQQNTVDRRTAKRVLSDLEQCETAVRKERALIIKNRMKLEYGILAHPTHARLGEAYLAAITDALAEPSDARVKKRASRENREQSQFRSLIERAYVPAPGTPEYKPPRPSAQYPDLWCPVTGAWHDARQVKAGHLVPYAIGETNAVYIFGLPVLDGWKAIWDWRNGLPLAEEVEACLDRGQIVIVPVEDTTDEFKLIVLDDSILCTAAYRDGPNFRELDQAHLQFKTEARPGKRYLYFHCLITLFRRHRFYVEGCERDQDKIRMGKVWGTPGKWLRGSIVRALALEIGDICHADEFLQEDLADPTETSVERERQLAVEVKEVVTDRGVGEKQDEDENEG